MKRWFIFFLMAALLCTGSIGAATVEARDSQKSYSNSSSKEQNKLRFQFVEAKTLNKQQRAFVEKVKVTEGIHQSGNLFVLSSGQKPNAGYTMNYVHQYTAHGKTTVYIKLGKPSPKKFYTQVITYPHLIGIVKGNPEHVRFVNYETGKDLYPANQPFITPLREDQLTNTQRAYLNKVKTSQGIFRTGNIVIISLGKKNTAGYGIQLVKQKVSSDTATAFFKLTTPDRNQMHAQYVNYPYFLGKINLPTNKPIDYVNIDTGLELFKQSKPIFKPLTTDNLTANQLAFANRVKSTQGIHWNGDFVVIALGKKNTSGYSLSVISQKLTWEQATITVKINQPDPNQYHSQTITYPYLAGNVDIPPYTTLTFINADTGKPLFE